MTEKLLISACLLGHPVRYDGRSVPLKDLTWLQQLQKQNRLILICPEQSGGLATPRDPAERINNKVITINGQDVTDEFQRGAHHALTLCKKHNIKYALLKAKSPSCGNSKIYDGTFTHTLQDGTGVTSELLTNNGIKVFSELEIPELKLYFNFL